ncbi:unnamed protein product [Acanthoscelides obtectus]|uniref:Uncharacterized protein n=1 Tax=Acanthoscelides obtectus TaxID=200917 RepID=A0A9P0PLH6_ACAOB|nr:unnamed protein product [Acanthoscelides obtectus]CAK1648827.1 hypothetical protein AOBTE_LOCUS15907 [Acanthoscelides obtectus]
MHLASHINSFSMVLQLSLLRKSTGKIIKGNKAVPERLTLLIPENKKMTEAREQKRKGYILYSCLGIKA